MQETTKIPKLTVGWMGGAAVVVDLSVIAVTEGLGHALRLTLTARLEVALRV